jgi:hypothetical protein
MTLSPVLMSENGSDSTNFERTANSLEGIRRSLHEADEAEGI